MGGGELHLSPGESKFKARRDSTVQNSLSQFSLHYHPISAYQNGELTNGFVKLAQKFTKGGGGGDFKEGLRILNCKKKELTNSQMCSSDQRICGQKGSSRGNKAER